MTTKREIIDAIKDELPAEGDTLYLTAINDDQREINEVISDDDDLIIRVSDGTAWRVTATQIELGSAEPQPA
jgi:hypothetical protein